MHKPVYVYSEVIPTKHNCLGLWTEHVYDCEVKVYKHRFDFKIFYNFYTLQHLACFFILDFFF